MPCPQSGRSNERRATAPQGDAVRAGEGPQWRSYGSDPDGVPVVSEGAIMTLPLSKTLDPADYTALAEELAIVDRHFEAARPQHPARKWEYSMALRALHTWSRVTGADGPIYDVGGGGSPFVRILTSSPAI